MFFFIISAINNLSTTFHFFLNNIIIYISNIFYTCTCNITSEAVFYGIIICIFIITWILLHKNKIYYTGAYIMTPLSIIILSCLQHTPWYTTVILTSILVGLGLFFRNPNRIVTEINPNEVLSPADGVVLDITYDVALPVGFQDLAGLSHSHNDISHNNHMHNHSHSTSDWTKVTKISIFMRVSDVHVNRAPIAGKVLRKMSFSGEFMYAAAEQADRVNERVGLWIKGLKGSKAEVIVFQIAGMLAKRVLCHANQEDILTPGEIYGVIQFGSRADIYFPNNITPLVTKGQVLKAGLDIIARWND